jgi:hypothetical protein
LEEALVPAPRSGFREDAQAIPEAVAQQPTPLWNVGADLIGPAQPAGNYRLFDANLSFTTLEPTVIRSQVRPRYAAQRDFDRITKPVLELSSSEMRVRELDVERLGGGSRDGFFIPTVGSLTVAGTGFLLVGSTRRRRD